MSRPQEVRIFVLGGVGSGRTTLIRRFVHGIFDNSYDPTDGGESDRKLIDLEDTKVIVDLCPLSANISRSNFFATIGPAHAIISVIAPENPIALEETLKFRLDTVKSLSGSDVGDRIVERVAIMKDIEVPWNIRIPRYGEPEIEPEVLSSEERKKREEEWQGKVEKGYDFANKLGVKVTVVCPRTGEGVDEVFTEVVREVFERRKARSQKIIEEEKRQEEKRRRAAQSPMARLKRLFSKVA